MSAHRYTVLLKACLLKGWLNETPLSRKYCTKNMWRALQFKFVMMKPCTCYKSKQYYLKLTETLTFGRWQEEHGSCVVCHSFSFLNAEKTLSRGGGGSLRVLSSAPILSLE